MTNKLSVQSLAPVAALVVLTSLILALFGALPASAQVTPQEKCTLVRAITIHDQVLAKDFVIEPGTAKVSSTNNTTPLKTSEWGTICLINTINTVVDWVFLLLLVVAVAFIAIAGFLWMTGGAKPDQQKMAGSMIMAAIIGIVIAVLARLLPAVVTGILL